MVGAESSNEEVTVPVKDPETVAGYANRFCETLNEVKSTCEEIKIIRERVVQSIDEATARFLFIINSFQTEDNNESQI